MAACAFKISFSCIIRGCVNNSTVVFDEIAFVLNKLNTAAPAVRVTDILSALPESSDTNIDLTMLVVAAGLV